MPYYESYYVPVDAAVDVDACELEALQKLLMSKRFQFYVEVGVGRMGTLYQMAKAIKGAELSCRCVGIDAFGELPRDAQGNNTHQGDVIRFEEAKDFLVTHQLESIVALHQGDSSTILKKILRSMVDAPKLIFIDANHSYEGCRADFEAADEYVRRGDVLVFHDTLESQHEDYGHGPRGVIEDCLLPNARYRLLTMPPPEPRSDGGVNTMSIFECLG